MNIEVPIPDKDYKVLVRCATYNHSKYICDALNGFAIQETDFPFICIVVDDASKDGNQEVIKQYANDNCDMSKAEISEDDISKYIRVPHKTNTNCVFLFCLLKVNLYCKPEKQEIYKPYREVCEYEALCEGDDWWLTENKLQTQYDTLEEHLEVDMCACGTICYRDGKAIKEISPSSTNRTLTVNETILGGGGFLGTNSLMCRVSLLHDNFQFWRFFRLDYFLQIHGALRGGIFYLSDCMSAYRLSSYGSWTKTFKKNYNYWYFHRRKVIYTLELLNIETNYIHKQIIDQKISELYIGLFNFGFKSSVFHDAIKQMSLSRKIAYIINVCYGLLRR